MNSARMRLATLLRLAMPEILQQVAEEAARSTNAASAVVRATAQEYEAWMWRYVPKAIEAVSADDQQRGAILGSFAMIESNPTVRPVPPVARVGLLSIGVRLGRERIEQLAGDSPEAAEVMREFDLFTAALRASVATLVALS
ncbi:MAG: hypothetical protein E6J19_13310 [Chloroflexi bacterium]|nr:MAG: hypothetical protein E6J19_13310 [Chloroflexota bacterium]